ncbi:MAG: hypothetical protein A3I66_12550 [Burkholderiales bacterium RIFCSPLOWO2_02_FULL_57_36]|nr:MAG: hypothetical protein A3I66_12550 [Burkholderiales bacterium RIFCSPLOWO2_02_FULL_57_36]
MSTAREKIIRTTQRLLGQSGLSGAGLNQVIAASKAPRGSIYHYFPQGKTQLVTEALDSYGDYFQTLLNQALSREAPIGENLERLLLTLADGMDKTDYADGCPVGAVILDLDRDSDALRAVCQGVVIGWQKIFEQHLVGIPKPRRHDLANFIIAALEGALMLCRMESSSRPLRTTAVMLRRHVEFEQNRVKASYQRAIF